MKVKIDASLCSGHGRCYVLAPDVYRLDDDGYNEDRGGPPIDVEAGHEESALRGVKNCPEAAISVVEE